jgi:hypothetical protein
MRTVAPPPAARRGLAAVLAVVAAGAATACATAGATFRSGVGDAFPARPPYYAGAPLAAVRADTGRVGHLPVVYQRGASQAAIFDPRDGPGTPVGALLADMTDYLDALGATPAPGGGRLSVRLVEGGRVSAVAHAQTAGPPDVHFGCVTESGRPDDDCAPRQAVAGGALGRGRETMMRLAVGRPAAAWVGWARDVTREAGVDRVLVLTLEVGRYWPRQVGARGDKVVDLGTGHAVTLPWLTSLETPVSVLQLTGALVDRDGRAVRIGAEGVLARRTRLAVSAAGAEELLTDEDVARARTLRRDDLPGRPYAWQVALRTLVAELTGRPLAMPEP